MLRSLVGSEMCIRDRKMEAFVLYEENDFLLFKVSVQTNINSGINSIEWYSSTNIKKKTEEFGSGQSLGLSVVNRYRAYQQLNRKECIYKNADIIVAKSKNQNAGYGKFEETLYVYTRPCIKYSTAYILHPQQNTRTLSTSILLWM